MNLTRARLELIRRLLMAEISALENMRPRTPANQRQVEAQRHQAMTLHEEIDTLLTEDWREDTDDDLELPSGRCPRCGSRAHWEVDGRLGQAHWVCQNEACAHAGPWEV